MTAAVKMGETPKPPAQPALDATFAALAEAPEVVVTGGLEMPEPGGDAG